MYSLFFLRRFADCQDHHRRAIYFHSPDERRLEDAAVWSGEPPPLSSIHLLSAFRFTFRNSVIRVHAILHSRHTPPGGGIIRERYLNRILFLPSSHLNLAG